MKGVPTSIQTFVVEGSPGVDDIEIVDGFQSAVSMEGVTSNPNLPETYQ